MHLGVLLFVPGKVNQIPEDYRIGVFACGCACLGTVAVVLDIISFKVTGKSYLDLAYSWPGALGMIALWGLGAGIAGLAGSGLGILTGKSIACYATGFAWPPILPRVFQSVQLDLEDEQEDQDSLDGAES